MGNGLVRIRLFCENNEKKKAGTERRRPTGFSRVERTFLSHPILGHNSAQNFHRP